MRRVNLEVYGLPVNAFVISSDPRRLILNLSLHILKLCKSTVGDMMELGPFWLCCNAGWCMCFWGIIISWDVDELEDEWSSSDYATTTRKKVSANDIL